MFSGERKGAKAGDQAAGFIGFHAAEMAKPADVGKSFEPWARRAWELEFKAFTDDPILFAT